MKTTPLALAILCIAAATPSVLADTVVQWTFESPNTPADATNSVSISGVLPATGSGTASALHASAATDYTTPTGNGSAESLSSNTWAVGDYYQFQTSTTGLQDIGLAWDQTSSNTGPGIFDLLYSIDGSSFFLALDNYTVVANASPNTWSPGVPVPAAGLSIDLSGITTLDNATNVYFRLVDDSTISASGGTVATAGTSRVDNFTVLNNIPEPSVALSLLGGFGMLAAMRRRRA